MRKNRIIRKINQYGFTLIEMLVTLSVVSILLTVAVPSYQTFIQDSRLLAQSSSLHSAIMLAKSEAVKRSSRTTICSSTNGAVCNGGANWSNGWIVFTDPNGNGVVEAGEQILQVGDALIGGNTLNSNGANVQRVTFVASGFAPGFGRTFSLCDQRGAAKSKRLVLNNQGRLRTETGGGTCT